jgi:hypothetical protein
MVECEKAIDEEKQGVWSLGAMGVAGAALSLEFIAEVANIAAMEVEREIDGVTRLRR